MLAADFWEKFKRNWSRQNSHFGKFSGLHAIGSFISNGIASRVSRLCSFYLLLFVFFEYSLARSRSLRLARINPIN